MTHNMDWPPTQPYEGMYSQTQFLDDTGVLHNQFTDYQHQQTSPPTYPESTVYPGAAYTDMSNMGSAFDPQNGFDAVAATAYDNGSYLPHSQPNYSTSIASSLPVLGPDMVQAVLDVGIGHEINNSIERLSLENAANVITGADQLLTPHQRLNQFSSYANSMDSASTSGSITNGPTLISDGVPMSNLNMQQESGAAPHSIEIIEEPMEFGYRFRYEVEGKAHGGLQGNSSKSNGLKRANKIYPEIQVCNVPSHVNEIEIEARLVSATEEYFPHPNKCSGKDCNERGVFKKTLKRNEHPEFKLVLNNLTVLQIKKGDQTSSLVGQLLDINDSQRKLNRQEHIVKDVKVKADELAKSKHNGVVRIRFQAAYFDHHLGVWQVVCKHSNSVHDQKQTNAAELRICRISASTAPAAGGQEVFLLCEKVTKDDIKVKFQDGSWEVDGSFHGTDVHYQFAIVFRVPAYKKLDIKKPVEVNLKLFRPSTGTYSKAVPFTYHPNQSNVDDVRRKKRRIDSNGPSNMGGYKPYPHQPFGDFRPPPSNDGAGPSHSFMPGGGSYNNPSQGYYNRPDDSPPAESTTDEMPMDLTKNNGCPSTIELVEADNTARVDVKLEKVDEEIPAAADESVAADKSAKVVPIIKEEPEPAADADADDTDSEDIEADGCPQEPRYRPEPLPHHAQFASKSALLQDDSGDIHKTEQQLSALSFKEKLVTKAAEKVNAAKQELKKERVKQMNLERHVVSCEDFVVESLMNYAVTGDHLYFVSQFRYFLGVKDEYGDNSLHLAVINGQPKALNDMLSICMATKTNTAVNQLNDKFQTPIHVATIIRNSEMVDMLLRHDADPTIPDSRGSNCFHTAAENKDHKTMELLCRWVDSNSRNRESLNELNYDGETPLHKAVHIDSMGCVQELLRAGADVNMGDGTSGRTALHYTVQSGNIVNTAELLCCPTIDVNTAAYDGNAALHLAISLNKEDIAKLLIKSGANPKMKNRQMSYEREDGEIYGLDAYELCDGNEEMLAAVDTTPKRSSKPHSVLSDRIQSLPDETVDRLSTLLNRENKDWKQLASFFDLSSLIDFMEKQANPTARLFNYLGNNDKTITDLKDGLRTIERQDCVELIERAFMLGLSRGHKGNAREGSIKDSGFGECTSENLKSDYSGYLR